MCPLYSSNMMQPMLHMSQGWLQPSSEGEEGEEGREKGESQKGRRESQKGRRVEKQENRNICTGSLFPHIKVISQFNVYPHDFLFLPS